MKVTTLVACSHGRRRPHAWWCTAGHDCGFRAHLCLGSGIPLETHVEARADGDRIVLEYADPDDPSIPVDFCRCSAAWIVELADGTWRHLDPVLAANCMDTRPIEDPT